eukprot:403346405
MESRAKAQKSQSDLKQNVPAGYQVLTEGQAQILYKEEKLQADENNMIKTGKGKRQANDQNDVRGTVFYNPVQEFNRDFSILAIREFAKLKKEEREKKGRDFQGISILEALAATGLRSVRYMKEIQPVKLLANDIDPTATELMKKNFDFNGIDEKIYQIATEDAIDVMNLQRRQKTFFDVVDLDPYGTAVPFLESALNSLANGGLLAVTFTDMAVLCARNPQVTFYKYGGSPHNKRYCHEMALRLVLHMISEMASRQQRYIEPLISLTVDFYVRLFIRVHDGAQKCHSAITKYSHVFQCLDCESFWQLPFGVHMEQEIKRDEKGHVIDKKTHKKGGSQYEEHRKKDKEEEIKGESKIIDKYQISRLTVPNRCTVCEGPIAMGGPIWNQKIHDVNFAQRLLEVSRKNSDKKMPEEQKEVKLGTSKRIEAILSAIIDEDVCGDQPLSFDFSQIASSLKSQNPKKNELFTAFKSLGYNLTQTYYEPKLYKTNAPPEVIYDIFKAFKTQDVKNDQQQLFKNIHLSSFAHRILSAPIKHQPNFVEEIVEGQEPKDKKKVGKKRYLPNPQPNWGPKARATGNNK